MLWGSARHGGHMGQYYIRATGNAGSIALESPLDNVAAYRKVLELAEHGFNDIVITNAETGREFKDVDDLLLNDEA